MHEGRVVLRKSYYSTIYDLTISPGSLHGDAQSPKSSMQPDVGVADDKLHDSYCMAN